MLLSLNHSYDSGSSTLATKEVVFGSGCSGGIASRTSFSVEPAGAAPREKLHEGLESLQLFARKLSRALFTRQDFVRLLKLLLRPWEVQIMPLSGS